MHTQTCSHCYHNSHTHIHTQQELTSKPDNDVVLNVIDKDLDRTFPTHVLFQKSGSQGYVDQASLHCAQCQQLGTHLLSLQASRPPQGVESLRHAQWKDRILPGVYLHPVFCHIQGCSWGQYCVYHSTGHGTSCSDLTNEHDSRGRDAQGRKRNRTYIDRRHLVSCPDHTPISCWAVHTVWARD